MLTYGYHTQVLIQNYKYLLECENEKHNKCLCKDICKQMNLPIPTDKETTDDKEGV